MEEQEPSGSGCAVDKPSELDPELPLHRHRRHPDLQHPDSPRRIPHHKPTSFGQMLALRCGERLPDPHHEEVQAQLV